MLIDAFEINRLSLYQADASGHSLVPYASWKSSTDSGVEVSDPMPSEFVKQTVCAWCFENKESAHIARGVEDSRESVEVHRVRAQKNIGATVCVPVMSGDRIWGILKLCRNFDKRDFDENEINTIHTVIDQMSTALQRDELIRTVQHQAVHDSLTSLPNRRGLEEYLTEILDRRDESEVLKAVLFFDLDGFKDINDTHGHAGGDAVLQQVAARMISCNSKDAMLARLGGDEFAVVLPRLDSMNDAVEIASEYAESFVEDFSYDGNGLKLGASIGISYYPRDGVNMDDLIRHADMAMYQAKRAGKNRIVCFDKDRATAFRDELNHEKDLRKAVSEQQFDLWYQPLLCLNTGFVSGVEALIRWQHPTKGILPPTKFIPLAEELGLISMVGSWVLERGCQQMIEWQHLDPVPWHLGINVAGPQLMSKGFGEAVIKLLDAYKIDPSQLQLEVTESVFMNDLDRVVDNLNMLRGNGVRIALDDFGTGYSSLQYLQELPLDLLKIDRAFISKLDAGNMLESLAKTIVVLANRFGLQTVAEGVETKEQLDLVKQLNCDLVQGFYFSRPVMAGELPNVISSVNQWNVLQDKAAYRIDLPMSNSILLFLVVLQAVIIVWLASKLKQYQKLDQLLGQRFPEVASLRDVAGSNGHSKAVPPALQQVHPQAQVNPHALSASSPAEAGSETLSAISDEDTLEDTEENIEEAKLVQQVMARCRYAEFYLEQLDDDYERGQFRRIIDDCVSEARGITDHFFRDNALHPIILVLDRADWNNYRDALLSEDPLLEPYVCAGPRG